MMAGTNYPGAPVGSKKKALASGLLAVAVMAASLLGPGAPDAHAKKRHHHRINTVHCPNQTDNKSCVGTARADRLVGTEAFDSILGGEGNDVYDGKGGSDRLSDGSTTSNDRYVLPSTEFGSGVLISDGGGSSDVLDLSAYRTQDFGFSRDLNTQSLKMNGPGNRDITVNLFFTNNTIDAFKFSDSTQTADFIKSNL
jgi:Ca2+-binding RTX toxin-like protein